MIEKGLMEGFEKEDGELMIWWTELGKEIGGLLEKEQQNETNQGNQNQKGIGDIM